MKVYDYKVGGGIKARNMAKDAIRSGLFVKKWKMIDMLLRCVEGVAFRRFDKRSYWLLALVYDDDEPIGVCCIEKDVMAIYVRSRYRRKGIGKSLVDLLDGCYGVRKNVVV